MKNEPISLEETKVLLGYYGAKAKDALIANKLREDTMDSLISACNAMKEQYHEDKRKVTEFFNEKE